MSANIHSLPFEQLLHIYRLCRFSDLLNIALCSRSSYDSVKEILWKVVEISWASVAHDSFKKRQLSNLRYTTVLRFRGFKDITGKKFAWDSVRVNFKNILDCCDANKLVKLEINGVVDDEGVEIACRSLHKLQEISISRCKHIYSGWLWLDGLRELKKLVVDRCPITKADMENLVKESKLHELKLMRCENITNEVFNQLTNLTNLKSLELVFSKKGFVEEYKYKNLANFPNLQELSLKGLRITNEVMPDISNIMGLKILSLDFDYNLITEVGLCYLGNLSSLKKLSLARCNHIPDSGFFPLTKLVSLQELNLNHCRKLSAIGLSHISMLNSLIELNVSNCPVNDSGFSHLCNLKRLNTLNVFYCCKITDVGLSLIGKLKSLKVLHAGGRKLNLTDLGLLHICELNTLRHLDLSCCNDLTDKRMPFLTKLEHLETLNINNCTYISDAGLSYLQSLECLRVLCISGLGKVTDNGLLSISKLPLVELDISYSTLISDIGLAHISKLLSLRKLVMVHCSSITDRGLSCLGTLQQLSSINVSTCRYITDKGILYLCKLPYLKEISFVDCGMVNIIGFSAYPHIHFLGDSVH